LGPGPSLEDRLPLELDVTVTGQKKSCNQACRVPVTNVAW
jgi:hypothetical protein